MDEFKKVLHLLRIKARPMTIAEIAEYVGISPKTARRYVNALTFFGTVYDVESFRKTAAYAAHIPSLYAEFLSESISLLKRSLEVLQQHESTDVAACEKRNALIAELKEWLFVK